MTKFIAAEPYQWPYNGALELTNTVRASCFVNLTYSSDTLTYDYDYAGYHCH
jgi:hypothetical protein